MLISTLFSTLLFYSIYKNIMSKKKEVKSKKTLLIYSDSPLATTGLGKLTRHMIEMFSDRFDITVFGINHPDFLIQGSKVTPIHDSEKFKCKLITPMPNGGLGHNEFAMFLQNNTFDLILTSHDWNSIAPMMDVIMQQKLTKGTKWITYIPVDRKHFFKQEADMLSALDYIVAESNFGLDKIVSHAPYLDKKMKRIWHPIDINDFPIPDKKELRDFKKQYFKKIDPYKHFIIGWVDRNIFRKDPHRMVTSFGKFRQEMSDARLYMHCTQQSVEGYDLAFSFRTYDIDPDMAELPALQLETRGIKKEFMNLMYRAIKVKVSTSQGEGFGYTNVEALAAGIPVIAPNNTTFPELIGENGYLVDCDDEYLLYGVNSVPRDVINTTKLVDSLKHVYNNYDEAKEKAQNGRIWVKNNLNLHEIKKQWNNVFDQLSL